MDPCFYFDEEANNIAQDGALGSGFADWLPLLLEGAALALIFTASAIGLLREEHHA